MASKAGYSTALNVAEMEREIDKKGNFIELTAKQKFELGWKEFIPAAAVGAVTVTSIIMANQIGSRRAAAITAAFKLSEELSADYKKKVVESLGLQKEEKIRSELAADKINANPPNGLIVVAGSDVLFFDEFSGRYFSNQVEAVRKAVNDVNHKVNNYMFASLTDFYEMIGLPGTGISDEVGWNTDELLDVSYSATLYDNKPAIMISYETVPTRSYDRLQ